MKKFVIFADSCCDLPKDIRQKYDIEYFPMRILFDDKDLAADIDFGEISFHDFYNLMRDGKRVMTSQVSNIDFTNGFEKWAKEGYDVLYLACSSALSASYKASLIVKKEVEEKYPDTKIVCVDCKNSCLGEGIIALTAADLRNEGKSIDEVVDYIEKTKFDVNQYAVVDDLIYLKRAGRVSATSAFFGGILQVKPIIISDENGQNLAIKKVRGRALSIKAIVQMFVDRYQDNPHQRIFVCHADCEEDCDRLLEQVKEAMPDKNIEVIKCGIGPIIGASVGPGTLAIYSYGKSVVTDKNF